MTKPLTLEQFLLEREHFSLGFLPTENPHPESHLLAEKATSDLPRAIDMLLKVDELALSQFLSQLETLQDLHRDIQITLKNNHRIFLVGCGATGRLSLVLEKLWRLYAPENKKHLVRGIIAGGELALIHSLESFEDYPVYGEYQLREAGLNKDSKDDLVIAITEGGETPFVLGAAHYGSLVTDKPVHLLFCNPKTLLKDRVERSRRAIENSRIISHELYVGAMALSGSTRMQASTVLQLAVGGLLFNWDKPFARFTEDIKTFSKLVCSEAEKKELQKLIEGEALCYKNNQSAIYLADQSLALTLLTDTTERAPTFSLPNFENVLDSIAVKSLSYVSLKKTNNPSQAWESLLSRKPWPLASREFWHNLLEVAGESRMKGFDLSLNSRIRRQKDEKLPTGFELDFSDVGDSRWQASRDGDVVWQGREKDMHPLYQQTLLKMRLNLVSTLIMGRLERYHSNIMTWVRPSNRKLIDRALRNIRFLLQQADSQRSSEVSDETILQLIFELKSQENRNTPIVLDVFKMLIK
jgi:N-acetylmuramic acid 6-phosphate etherase